MIRGEEEPRERRRTEGRVICVGGVERRWKRDVLVL